MSVYSFSQIQLFNKCALKYRYKYLDKIQLEEFEQTADLFLWNAVHFALQKIYNDLTNFKQLIQDDLLWYYKSYWDDNSKDPIVVRYWTDLWDYKIRGNNYLETYFDKHFVENPSNIIATESSFIFDISDSIKFRWVIDRIDKRWTNFIINDYKTNKNLPPEQKDDYIEQITLYALWIQQKYWKYLDKIIWRLYFLHFDIVDEWEITNQAIENVVNKYKNFIQDIENKKVAFNWWDKNVFQPKESPSCNYCEYKTICPLFTHYHYDDESVEWLSDKTIKGIIDDYVRISDKSNELKWEKEMLKDLLVKYLQDKDFKILYWNEYKLWVSQLINYSIEDSKWVQKILNNLWLESQVMDVDRFKLAKLIKEWKIDYELLKDFVKKSLPYSFRKKWNL